MTLVLNNIYKNIIILLILTVPLFSGSIKDKNFGSARVAEVISIYDGDTFRVNIGGYPDIIGKRIPIRVNGVDTPELRSKCKKEKDLARLAKQFTVQMLRSAKSIELKNMQRGKYFRIVADVYADGKSLSKELINNNLAVPYFGGTKVKDWCAPR
jgi:endonuclease YncB( thermonuclease family)